MNYPKLAALGIFTAVTLGLQGCVVAIGDHASTSSDSSFVKKEKSNRKTIAALSPGTSILTVQQQLGTPEFSDLWTTDDAHYNVLYYRTQRVHADGMTTRDECTPLVFINGVLKGTGELALQHLPQKN
ncbi:Protein of unknown function [Pseudidiomarina indica]|uniref:DUF3192 domain-containing protein n=1 Tax=Pseudidiomarina indica TaxID=1159017 RepID=A0A1G6DID8_9GAMM|nr:DUF3192 domain-containing protein [Pseudidiomarina indica]SDB44957.1 Protein of unknown function [Pseudidiomarina indica]